MRSHFVSIFRWNLEIESGLPALSTLPAACCVSINGWVQRELLECPEGDCLEHARFNTPTAGWE